MLSILASHNEDIRRLVEKGYAASIDNNCLVIRDIPYLDNSGNNRTGAIVSKLVFVDAKRVQQEDHQIFFCGSHPCQLDGAPIANMGGGPVTFALTAGDIVVERSFSNKPSGGFADLFEKIESYVAIISGPATNKHGTNPLTFRTMETNSESVFNYADTLTSRAEIGDLSQLFSEEVVAVIGLGGTGSYLLDFLVKTPVKEIRGFDRDKFHVHNAFRSPGRLEGEELGMRKVEVYQNRYGSFRKGVNLQPKFITSDSEEDLVGVTFAFVCVDKGSARAEIVELLLRMQIPFIDVGMGLARDSGPISGTLRASYFSAGSSPDMLERRSVPVTDMPDEVYRNNIQISELNALNACIAIVKYKQLRNFYADDRAFNNILLTLDNTMLAGDEQ